MSDTLTLGAYRDSVARFAGHIEADSDLVDTVNTAIDVVDKAINLPGQVEFSMRVFMDGLTLPNAVTSVLSFAPFGIGAAVRGTTRVADEVTGALRPTWQSIKKVNDKLTAEEHGKLSIVDLSGRVSITSSAVKYSLDGAEIVAGNLLDTAGYLEEAMTEGFAPEGSRLEARIEASARFVEDVNGFHEGVARVTTLVEDMAELVGSTIGRLPTDVIDEAADLIDTVFSPISNAFSTIEDMLCTTITVTPRIPSVPIKVPIPYPPWLKTIGHTPEIPAVKVNICDVLDVITKQVALVQNFVENTINDALKLIGFDLFGAIDDLKDKLLSPFQSIIDLVDGFADRIDEIRDLIDQALDAVGRFFEDLGKLLQDAIDQVVLFEAGRVGDEAPGGTDDVLVGSVIDGGKPVAAALTEAALSKGQAADVEDGLFGRTGDDELMGLGGDDFLFGGTGEDTLEGGRDDDENYGGEGADTYVFAGDYGADFVSDRAGPSTFVFDAGAGFAYSRVGEDDLLIEAGRGSVRVDGFYEGEQRATTTIRIGETEMRVNTAPEALAATGTVVAEDAAAGTVVATLSASDADGDAIAYRLEDDAEGRFAVEGDRLVVAGPLDFETAAEHSVTVVAEDGYGGRTTETVTVTVEDVFEPGRPPEDLAFAGAPVAGDASAGTRVGTLSATDPEGEALAWRLLDDAGGRVRLDGTTVVVATALAIETDATLRFVAEAEDPLGNTASAAFEIAVEGVAPPDLAPERLALSGAEIAEDAAPGTPVGTLSAVDPEGQAVAFRLTDDAGGRFALDGVTLTTADSFDFETAESHSVTVEATDPAGNAATASFAVSVTDVAESEVTDPGEPSDPGETDPSPPETPPVRLEGTGDDDRFDFELPGFRTVAGEAGTDTASYALARAEVTDSLSGGAAVIATMAEPGDPPSGTERWDRLEGVERVELEDGTYLFDLRDEAAFTYRVYAATFGRTPDEGGLRYWDAQVEAGLAPRKLAEAFVGSREFVDRFGAAPEPDDFVDALYTNILGRVPDGAGREFWVGQIEDRAVDEADALLAFTDSPENLALNEDNYDAGVWVL